MSFTSAEHFAKQHGGFSAIVKLTELINSDRNLKEIGEQFGLSESQMCRLRAKLFRPVWTPRKGLIEYIEFQQSALERQIKEREEYKQKNKELTLIPGLLSNDRPNR